LEATTPRRVTAAGPARQAAAAATPTTAAGAAAEAARTRAIEVRLDERHAGVSSRVSSMSFWFGGQLRSAPLAGRERRRATSCACACTTAAAATVDARQAATAAAAATEAAMRRPGRDGSAATRGRSGARGGDRRTWLRACRRSCTCTGG